MSENDTMVIRALKDSFMRQLARYRSLAVTVQKILGKLILSRGDFSGVKADFAEKQRLLAFIEEERLKTAPHVTFWQERKEQIAGRSDARELDAVLRENETAIKEFLDGEDQLKRYLECMVQKAA